MSTFSGMQPAPPSGMELLLAAAVGRGECGDAVPSLPPKKRLRLSIYGCSGPRRVSDACSGDDASAGTDCPDSLDSIGSPDPFGTVFKPTEGVAPVVHRGGLASVPPLVTTTRKRPSGRSSRAAAKPSSSTIKDVNGIDVGMGYFSAFSAASAWTSAPAPAAVDHQPRKQKGAKNPRETPARASRKPAGKAVAKAAPARPADQRPAVHFMDIARDQV